MANWLKFINSLPVIFLALLFPYVLGLTHNLIPILLSLFTGGRDGNSSGSDSGSGEDSNLDNNTPAESSRSHGDDSTASGNASDQGSNLANTIIPESSLGHGEDSTGSGDAGVQGSFDLNEPYEDEDLFAESDRMDYVEIKRVYRVVYGFIACCIEPWITREVYLKLYGFHKVAKKGPCPESQLPPSPNKNTRDRMQAWKDVSGLSREDAMKGYIKFVLQHYPSDSNTKRIQGETSTAGEAGSSHGNSRRERSITKLLMDAIHYFLEHEETDFEAIERVPVDLKDKNGRTMLHWAASHGYLDVLSFLLNNGADRNAKDDEGQTPMHYAVIHKKDGIVSFLMLEEVDVHLKDNKGISASDLMNMKKDTLRLRHRRYDLESYIIGTGYCQTD